MTEEIRHELEYLDINSLHPYERNSNTHSDWQIKNLADSIRAVGFRAPVLADRDLTIIAGHGRVLAAMQVGMTAVPTIVYRDMTPAQARAYVISDNQLAKLSEWDHEILASELVELEQMDVELSTLGFDDKELARIRDLVPEAGWPDQEPIGKTDDDEVPDVPQNIHGVELGDVFQLGNHRLMCGDSTDKATVEKLMDGEKADMVFTDPPYGDNVGGLKQYAGEEKKQRNRYGKGLVYQDTTIKNDKTIEWLAEVFPIIPVKEKSTKLVFFKWDKFTDILNYAECWGKPSACLVWDRVRKVSAFFRFQPQHEFIFHWGSQADKREPSSLSNVFHIQKDELDIHPTVKPIDLLEPIIKVCSSKAEIICDPFLGSGSTLIACEKTNRKNYAMELDPHYVSVAIQRYINFVGSDKEVYLIDGEKRTHISEVSKMRK